jgi:hypothetical protein
MLIKGRVLTAQVTGQGTEVVGCYRETKRPATIQLDLYNWSAHDKMIHFSQKGNKDKLKTGVAERKRNGELQITWPLSRSFYAAWVTEYIEN